MCVPSSIAIGEVHRNTKVCISLLESYTVFIMLG